MLVFKLSFYLNAGNKLRASVSMNKTARVEGKSANKELNDLDEADLRICFLSFVVFLEN